MFAIIKSTDDPVVATYLDIIKAACEKNAAAEYKEHKAKDIAKSDTVVSIEALISVYYIFRGYKNIMTWFQGIVPEESYMRNRSKIRYMILSMAEYITLKKSKFVFFVSDEMKRHYEKKYRMDLSGKSFIMPCFNETAVNDGAFEAEDKYKENRFVYVGGMQAWQCFGRIAEIYREIEEKSGEKTQFCVFTSQKDEAEKYIKEAGIENYSIDFVPKNQLAERIAKMKYGFVIREDTDVNRVATPTKFSNYLANGIIPVYSDCLDSFKEFDKRAEIGIIYDGDTDKIKAHMRTDISKEEMYEKCKKAFETYYNAEKYTSELAECLKKLDK